MPRSNSSASALDSSLPPPPRVGSGGTLGESPRKCIPQWPPRGMPYNPLETLGQELTSLLEGGTFQPPTWENLAITETTPTYHTDHHQTKKHHKKTAFHFGRWNAWRRSWFKYAVIIDDKSLLGNQVMAVSSSCFELGSLQKFSLFNSKHNSGKYETSSGSLVVDKCLFKNHICTFRTYWYNHTTTILPLFNQKTQTKNIAPHG